MEVLAGEREEAWCFSTLSEKAWCGGLAGEGERDVGGK